MLISCIVFLSHFTSTLRLLFLLPRVWYFQIQRDFSTFDLLNFWILKGKSLTYIMIQLCDIWYILFALIHSLYLSQIIIHLNVFKTVI